ncbi:MAG TPA: TetR/AcrR family transcriptional regulator [Acidimicrobiales bacterium]|nr:TetR/AcrR family transcriptional regulator [Acidimicrobiales bacterium]
MTEPDDDPSDPEVEAEPRSARTRRKLLDGALKAIDDRGFHATRVDDIVRHAGVSHGAFYLYFDDKQELFRILAAEAAEDMIARVEDLVGQPVVGEELVDWLEGFVDAYARHGAVIRAWMEDHARDRGLRKVANDAFGHIITDLAPSVDTKALGPLGPIAMLAMLERFTYFAISRGLPADRESLRALGAVIERGFLKVA